MESDLPLIEIDGEDNSLLQQLPGPDETSSKLSKNYFTCSPLQLPRSHTTKCLKDNMNMERPGGSSSKGSHNKENINSNTLEVSKLGMEPMQMKRAKKGGTYNLRKSLAWDKAFSTDEGILDPLELSLITGISGNTRGERLASICEEENSSFSANTRCDSDSEDTLVSDEALHKELPDKIHTLVGKGEKAGCSVGNHDLLPHDKVMQKVISIHCSNRTQSKVGGCPGSLGSSSLKRPATSNTGKTARKEFKLPKLPISKSGPCVPATTKGPMTASPLRNNLMGKPTRTVQKNVGSESSLTNLKGSQSKAKLGSGSLCLPAKDPLGNRTNSSSKAASSTKSKSIQVGKTFSRSKGIPDRLQLCQDREGSAAVAAKDLAQHTARDLTVSLPEAARLTGSRSSQFHEASCDFMTSDRLHPCERQEGAAILAVSRPKNLCSPGGYPPKSQPAKQSRLRLPSPSLRFFDQRIASESGSMLQKTTQQYNTNLDLNKKIDELRPPTVPARTPIKSNDIIQTVSSGVSKQISAPSTLTAHNDSTQMSTSIKYMGSITSGVSESNINQNFERKVVQNVDIEIQYECGSYKREARVVEQQQQEILRNVENTEIEKFVVKGDGEVKVTDNQVLLESWPSEQLGEGNAGYNKVGLETSQFMLQVEDEKGAIVPGTKGKLVHQNEEYELQNCSSISKSMSGKAIQHQEYNLLTLIDNSTKLLQDFVQKSKGKADTEKSDATKMDLGSHLDGSCLEAADRVSKVSEEYQKDRISKGDDIGAPKCAGPGLENYYDMLQHQKIDQDKSVANGVDEFCKRLSGGDDSAWLTNSPCLATKENISITSAESLKNEAGNGGNTDTRDLKCTETMVDTYCTSFHYKDTKQENYVGVFSSRSPVRDAVLLLPHDNPSAEGFHINPSSCIKNNTQLEDISVRSAKCSEGTITCHSMVANPQSYSEGGSVDCRVPAECSKSENPPRDHAIESIVYFVQERSGSDNSSAIHMEVPGQKLDGGVEVDLTHGQPHAEAQMRLVEVTPLVDDPNQSSLPHLTPEVELISGAASVADDARLRTNSVLQMTQCADTYPQSSEIEELNIALVTSEAEFEIHEELCSWKGQETGISIGSSLEKGTVPEESQQSFGNILDAGVNGFGTSHIEFVSACQTLKDAGVGGNCSESHIDDAQVQLLDENILVGSCSRFTPVLHDHILQIVDHGNIEEQAKFLSIGGKVEQVSTSNDQLLTNTEESQQECVWKSARNGAERSDIHECHQKTSDIIVHTPPVAQEDRFDLADDGRMCTECATSGSTVESIAEHYTERQLRYNTECCDLTLLSELEGKDQMVGISTSLESCSADGKSCSFPSEVVYSMEVLKEKPVVYGSSIDTGRVLADIHQLCTNDVLLPEKIVIPEEPNNILDSISIVPEQAINHRCDIASSNSNAQTSATVQENVFELDGDDQPFLDNAPQGSVRSMPPAETIEYFTNGQSGNGLEISGQDSSEFKSNILVSEHPSTCVNTTSTTFCSVTTEFCSVAAGDNRLLKFTIGSDGSKTSLGEEAEAKTLQEENSPSELHHELDSGSGLEKEQEGTGLIKQPNNIKRHDNPLVIHPPNAVPFSDEWLAAFEAAGEEILSLKCGAVQHSPPDKSLPEPSPWSPVKKKANQIGPYDCTKYTNTMPADPH